MPRGARRPSVSQAFADSQITPATTRLLGVLLFLIATPPCLSAQLLRGVVTDTTAGVTVASARVTMTDAEGQVVATAVTSRDGAFVTHPPGEGSYIVSVQQIGYRPLVANPELLHVADTLDIVYYLHRLPVELDPVTVEAEARVRHVELRHLEQNGFFRRARMTDGKFLDPEAIDRRRDVTHRADEFLIGSAHVMGVMGTMRGYRLRCGRPAFYIDDRRFSGRDLDQAIAPENVLAIEIYDLVRMGQRTDIMYGSCAIVVWTKARAEEKESNR